MKLLKNYKSKRKLRDEYQELKEHFEKLIETNVKLNKNIFNKQLELKEKDKEIKSLKRKKNSSKGGFMTKINELNQIIFEKTNKITELEDKLKDAMSDKYLVRKIPSGRPPHQNKMKVKSCAKTSSISKLMHPQKEE